MLHKKKCVGINDECYTVIVNAAAVRAVKRSEKVIYQKMKIMVSACLLGENCKYNGGNNYSEAVMKYVEGHEVIPVCPEVMGGLPTPRVPSEIVRPAGSPAARVAESDSAGAVSSAEAISAAAGVVTNREGVVVDEEFRRGAQLALEIAKAEDVALVILQSRSPSCGVGEIYDGTFTKTLIKGDGIFAALLKENGFTTMDAGEIEI